MIKQLNNQGFASMIEVIVSAIFFTVAAVGIFTSISMLRPQGAGSEKRLEASYVAKGIMDELRAQVDASTWNQPGGPHEPNNPQTVTRTVGPTSYTVDYEFIDYPNLGMRELLMNVSW